MIIIGNFNNKNIILKSYVSKVTIIEEFVKIESLCIIKDKIKVIGRGTYINNNVIIDRCDEIGRYCSISKDVSIGLGSHPTNMVSSSPLFYSKNRGLINEDIYNNKLIDKGVIIKNDVWIGSGAVIMPGVIIGNGAIVGAGAIVTKNVPDYAIVTGIPASVKKYRFNKEVINRLLKSEWWNLPINVLKNNYILMKDPEKFLEILEKELIDKKL